MIKIAIENDDIIIEINHRMIQAYLARAFYKRNIVIGYSYPTNFKQYRLVY